MIPGLNKVLRASHPNVSLRTFACSRNANHTGTGDLDTAKLTRNYETLAAYRVWAQDLGFDVRPSSTRVYQQGRGDCCCLGGTEMID